MDTRPAPSQSCWNRFHAFVAEAALLFMGIGVIAPFMGRKVLPIPVIVGFAFTAAVCIAAGRWVLKVRNLRRGHTTPVGLLDDIPTPVSEPRGPRHRD